MNALPDPVEEEMRAAALSRLSLAGENDDPEFDEIVRIATHMCSTSMAAITFVDDNVVWLGAATGLSMTSTPREGSFCQAAIRAASPLVIENALEHEQFKNNPLVTGPAQVRYYAAAPLALPTGETVGTIAVFDQEPRAPTANELASLSTLARQVVAHLMLRDVSNRRRAENLELQAVRRSIVMQSNLDELTGLLSRRGISAEIERLRAGFDGPVGVLLCDLDRFKLINNSLGEAVGDRVLQVVAQRVRATLRSNDIIGRVGADEFVVFLPAIALIDLETVASRLQVSLEQPIPVADPPLRITASIGTAIEPTAHLSTDRLHLNADYAMYTVKQQGGGRVINAGQAKESSGDHLAEFEREQFVRTVVAEGLIEMFYQPLVDAVTYEPHGYEALLRWLGESPDGLNPQEFINIAEQCGLIEQLGVQVLAHACAAAAEWQDEQPGVGVSVNVSPTQLVSEFVTVVDNALQTSGLDPALLTLEITESSAMCDLDVAHDIVRELYERGIRISLDDFGTGFASMAQLVEFPFHELKIDRSFCMSDQPSSLAVIRASVSLAETLGASVVAEGIETEPVRDRLIGLGANILQGYHFGRPAPLDRRALRPDRARKDADGGEADTAEASV